MPKKNMFMFSVKLEDQDNGRVAAELTASTEDGQAPEKEEIVMAVRHMVKFLMHQYPGEFDEQTLDTFTKAEGGPELEVVQ